LAEINAARIAGLRSRTLSGHPDNAVRALMLSERLRNLEPRLRSSKAFFSSDFRLNHSIDTPIIIPVKKDERKSKPTLVVQCEEVAKNGSGDSVRKSRRGYTARIGEDVFLQPFFEDRRKQRDQQKTPNPKQKLFKPIGHRALLVSTIVTDGQLTASVDF
jgi:hypothetical protein